MSYDGDPLTKHDTDPVQNNGISNVKERTENQATHKGSIDLPFQGEYGLKTYFQIDLSSLNRAALEAQAERFVGKGKDRSHYSSLNDEELRMYVERKMSSEHIGNLGVTARTLEDVQELIPDILYRLGEESSKKVIFLGNGVSLAPLEAMKALREAGKVPPKIVLHDIFDYHDLLRTLQSEVASRDAEKKPVESQLARDLSCCKLILEAERQGIIKLVVHAFGYDQPLPQELTGGNLVFNIYGPPHHTDKEQALCLANEGKLITSCRRELITGFQQTPLLYDEDTPTGFSVLEKIHS